MEAQSDVFVLIYYRFRGQMQPIRNLLFYLRLKFVEIHMQHLEEQRKQISPCIFQKLKGLKIQRSKLPLLVHDDLSIYEPFPIMNYLCRISMRQDLLGVDIFQKARVLEILQVYYVKQPQSMLQLFRVSDQSAHSTQEIINNSLILCYRQLINSSGYIGQICQYIQQRTHPKYIFANITILDFLFLETCIYMLGGFDKLDQMPLVKQLERQVYKYLSIMREYKHRMQNQSFYVEHRDYLQGFSIISLMTSPQRVKGLRKFWIGNPKFIK